MLGGTVHASKLVLCGHSTNIALAELLFSTPTLLNLGFILTFTQLLRSRVVVCLLELARGPGTFGNTALMWTWTASSGSRIKITRRFPTGY